MEKLGLEYEGGGWARAQVGSDLGSTHGSLTGLQSLGGEIGCRLGREGMERKFWVEVVEFG